MSSGSAPENGGHIAWNRKESHRTRCIASSCIAKRHTALYRVGPISSYLHTYCIVLTRTLILMILHVATPPFRTYTLNSTVQYSYNIYSNAVTTAYATDFAFERYTQCDVCE